RNSFRVAKNLLERLEPRVSKPTLGWNSRTLSALLVVPEFSHSLYRLFPTSNYFTSPVAAMVVMTCEWCPARFPAEILRDSIVSS
ncbi:MAG TPA: hypothetical protein VEW46_01150, partial [Pyrinomonadaceae bacterium]|nr:hypothetical protein [Pyrinomonadaceae bacterium]